MMHDPVLRAPPACFVPRPLAVLAWLLLQGASVGAQVAPAAPDEAPLPLKATPVLQEQVDPASRAGLPTFIFAERIFGRPDLETVLEGRAELRRGDLVIKADRLEYDQPSDLAKASGGVLINRAGNVYEGPLLELKLDAFEGFFDHPRYFFIKNEAHGEADRIDFIDEQRAVIHNATYTTCRRLPGPSWLPDWILRATSISLDQGEDVGTAKGAVLSFKGVPLLPIPYLSFPLSDKRKSGVMPPTLGLDNVNGAEVSVPYYWNIAPNRDATFTPTLMSKRGVNLGSEFRYLEADYAGQLRLDWMPSDQLRERNRWGLAYVHQAVVQNSWTERLTEGAMALNLNLNRVGDDNYWRDFARASTTSLTQRLLPSDATLSWRSGDFSNSVRTLKWQTLQDVNSPIVPPYDRLPQLTTRYARSNVSGFDYSVEADLTRFESERSLTLQPNGQRVFSVLQLSRPWLGAAGFITPKLQLHASNYQFDSPLANGATAATRFVPTISVDSGLVFERDAGYFGKSFRQTLEPRAFYVNTPFRDQSALPNYDSGAHDFNFATIYTDNAFVGNDRISDSNLLTLGVSTRLLDPATGAQVARFGVAQRLRFRDQNVTLPPLPGSAITGVPVTDRISDVLLGAAINWDPKWAFDSTVQFNPTTQKSVRSTIGARYSAGHYRTVSAAYRYQRDSSEQIDIGWQWPINDLWGDRGQEMGVGRGQGAGRWYSVGRLNYSMKESKLVDAVLGFEYDAGCWLGRIVLEQLQTSSASSNQRIMFQLEFIGLTRLGVSPLKSLKDNIPGYQYLRETTSPPSRFSNYD
ncbi:MAG: LPS-assembly protein LptD [Rhodoferax sp.]|nr:LPS-assembly protein LptD [Rhodoferax sp.]